MALPTVATAQPPAQRVAFPRDHTPPTGTIVIDGGAAYAISPTVTLTLAATDNSGVVTQMRFSNDGSAYSPWEPYATTRAWTLPSGDGPKTVFVTFQDAAGNESVPASDAITLDTTAPIVQITNPSNNQLFGAP